MNCNYLLQDYFINAYEKFSQNIALKSEYEEVTYQQLRNKSIAVSANLLACGMQKGDIVCLYTEKSTETIASIFGVLSAGGAYIPLDAVMSPIDSCYNIIDQSNSKILITSSSKLKQLIKCDWFSKKLSEGFHILVLDAMTEQNQIESCRNIDWNITLTEKEIIDRRGTDKDLAYILFTSGSTGRPKGVMLSHRNARTFVDWCLRFFKPNENDRFISIAPFHFDLSIFDIYVSLASGGRLVLMPQKDEMNPLKLIEHIKNELITYVYSVPSLWVAYFKYGSPHKEDIQSLKKILYAGEPFPIQYLIKLFEFANNREIYNMYGLIETNVFTYYKVGREDLEKGIIPIGYPCENSDAIVISDDGDEIIGIGEEGELCVRGSCVTKGYYNDENLTASRFIKSPAKRHHGDLVFRTGDIVSINENGAYVFHGRTDFMIKKNGFRIELLEIENVLNTNENVVEAVAVSVKNQEGQIFIGVYVTQTDNKLKVLEIKKYIAERLPQYMVPDYCLFGMDTPRNKNGKVDRQKIATYFQELVK